MRGHGEVFDRGRLGAPASALVAAFFAAAWPLASEAQEPPAAPWAPAPTRSEVPADIEAPRAPFVARGVEMEMQIGLGSFLDDSRCAFFSFTTCPATQAAQIAFGPGLGFQMRMAFRPFPLLSFGAHLGFQSLAPNLATRPPPPMSYSNGPETTSAFSMGIFVRAYPLPIRGERGLELSIGAGWDAHSRFSDARDLEYSGGGGSETVNGFYIQAYSFPIDVGVYYYVARGLGLGVTLAGAYWTPTADCAPRPTPPTYFGCTPDGLYGGVSWFAGLGVRYGFFL